MEKQEKQGNMHQYNIGTTDESIGVASGNVQLWSMMIGKGRKKTHTGFRERGRNNEAAKNSISNFNEMAQIESELLSHTKPCKLRYFGHVMRLP